MVKIENILAFDTSMSACSAAVIAADGKNAVRREVMPRGQSERLLVMVEEVLTEAGLVYKELDAIVTSIGPGAFTGLRIGLSTAKAFGLSLGVPVYGVSSLQALAYDVVQAGVLTGVDDKTLRVLVETRRDDFYVQDFDFEGQALSVPQALSATEISATMDSKVAFVAGDAVERFLARAPDDFKGEIVETAVFPDPFNMAQGLSLERAGYSEALDPLYLRSADVSQSKKEYRVLS